MSSLTMYGRERREGVEEEAIPEVGLEIAAAAHLWRTKVCSSQTGEGVGVLTTH